MLNLSFERQIELLNVLAEHHLPSKNTPEKYPFYARLKNEEEKRAIRHFLKKIRASVKIHQIRKELEGEILKKRLAEEVNAERREERSRKDKEILEQLKTNDQFSDYKNVFSNARQMKRKFIAYLGPTNSGKTYHALKALERAYTGVYLAPLRLMALENYEKLSEKGLTVGLVTGEEKIFPLSMTHCSQTIETLDFDQKYEVAVIDECQLLGNVERGGAWLNAIWGVAAETIYLCGALHSENILRQLVAMTGDDLEVIKTERLSPIQVNEHKENAMHTPEPGTAFICFSRKQVLKWKDLLESAGHSVAVIYGALSPEVRKEQSRRFREGEVDYLVSTDAIGMGLNLPIRKIIFTEKQKFDGKTNRLLTSQEVKQIGGRAGRYGVIEETGEISSFQNEDLSLLSRLFYEEDEAITLTDVHLKPTYAHVRMICDSFNKYRLSSALDRFKQMGHEIFSIRNSEDEEKVSRRLDNIFGDEECSLEEKWCFFLCPIDLNSDEVFDAFVRYAVRYKKVLNGSEKIVGLMLGPDNDAPLKTAEDYRKIITLYLWLTNKRPDIFNEKEKASELAKFYDNAINRLLSEQKKVQKTSGIGLKSCEECEALLPVFFKHSCCDSCYKEHQKGNR